MGFSLKKTLKKLEKTAKKVAPVAATFIGGPAAGALTSALQKGYAAAKAKAGGGGETSGDIVTIAGAGDIGSSGFVGNGLAFQSMGGPNPPGTDAQNARRVAAGDRGSGFQSMLGGKNTLLLIGAAGLALTLVFLIRRK